MKRKTLTTAVLAGLTGMAGMVGVSNAVNLNPDGLGQVLLYPYYSARGGNDTLVSIVNTTDNAKSVKIRFIEGLNSREVLDFNIYMSAYDVWVTAITGADNGGGKIIIADNTCTSPYFRLYPTWDPDDDDVAEVPFSRGQFTGDFADGATTEYERTASGYIEVIEMGTLVDDTEGSATAVTHGPDGSPADCQQIDDAWSTGLPAGEAYWLDDATVDHEAPSGGLFGGASLINVADGTMFSYNATALDAFSDSIVHTDPGTIFPNLNSGVDTSRAFINGVVDTRQWQEPVEAVSATILYDQVMNEYVTGGAGNARSEWVVTFPTKRFYVDTPVAIATPPVAPFTTMWDNTTGTACEELDYNIWNREERTTVLIGPPVPSPAPEDPADEFELCYESNVIRFADTNVDAPDVTEILKEPRFQTINSEGFDFFGGWVRFEFNEEGAPPVHATRPGIDPDTETAATYLGLPVVGFWVNTFTNGALVDDAGAAVLANYGGTFNHRGSRRLGEATIE